MTRPRVIIVPYDPSWPSRFNAERRRILRLVGPHIQAVEHIGSTAVPGLAAKPILDIMPGLRDLADAQPCIKPLATIGYEYVPEHEAELPERRYFRKGPPEGRTHHLHMVETTGDSWNHYLLFRDYLRSHGRTSREYETLKRRLARRHADDREAYTKGKAAFVQGVIERARREARPGSE